MGQLTHAYTEFTGYEPSSVIVFLKPRRKTRYWFCLNDVVKKISNHDYQKELFGVTKRLVWSVSSTP